MHTLASSLLRTSLTSREGEMILQKALMCLALNIYHESRGEPINGQIAVAMVTMNRADWKASEVCQVVYKKHQFSWTRNAAIEAQETVAWVRAKHIAKRVIEGQHEDITYGATHFHTRSARPTWRRTLKKTTTIGNHIFYAHH